MERFGIQRVICRMALLALAASHAAGAQSANNPKDCDLFGTTSFAFGRTGGNIRPLTTRIAVDGAVTNDSGVTTRNVSHDAVTAIARLAWTNGFAALPSTPTRPTRNPDFARSFIDLRSRCRSKHVELDGAVAPASFREVMVLLQAVVR